MKFSFSINSKVWWLGICALLDVWMTFTKEYFVSFFFSISFYFLYIVLSLSLNNPEMMTKINSVVSLHYFIYLKFKDRFTMSKEWSPILTFKKHLLPLNFCPSWSALKSDIFLLSLFSILIFLCVIYDFSLFFSGNNWGRDIEEFRYSEEAPRVSER